MTNITTGITSASFRRNANGNQPGHDPEVETEHVEMGTLGGAPNIRTDVLERAGASNPIHHATPRGK